MKIAFLASAGTMPGSPTRRADAFEHDYQIAALREGLAGSGAEVIDIDWRAPLEAFANFDLALLSTPWDYTEHRDEFLTRLEALEAQGTKVCNSSEVVRWNSDKFYLQQLAEQGAPSIPTRWSDDPGEADIRAAFGHFGTDRVIAKRRVGAGARGQESFTPDDPALSGWRMGQAGMIQPFLPAIAQEGEYSFIFVDGGFSHALIKQAAPGDYRIQSLYGGRETAISPASSDLASAEAIIALLPFTDLLYARIDMVRGLDGKLAVIEAEVIEPYLYPEQGPEFGARLAAAVLSRF